MGAVAFVATIVGGAGPGAVRLAELATQASPQTMAAKPDATKPTALDGLPAIPNSYLVVNRFDRWTDADERAFGEFISAIGDSGCRNVNACLHSPANPFRASDPQGIYFHADCADFPYFLRAYFAWKRGLPFSYELAVSPRGRGRDIRYTANGNQVSERRDVLSGSSTGYALLETLRDVISSASYRIHPDLDSPRPDMYSPAIDSKSIRPGTMIYDPNGHVGMVFKVEADGRVRFMDAHPDNSVTHGYYDTRFVRARPGMGAGFKNWRPITLVDYTRRSDGVLVGGRMVLAANSEIADYSDEQFFGNVKNPSDDSWNAGSFKLNGEWFDYYDYVRAKLAGGKLEFDPIKEVGDMVDSNCSDLHFRKEAVDLALAAGIQQHAQPGSLPPNIYGTEGDWETYSTPSRDARLKTAFKELRDKAERFVTMYRLHDAKLHYQGTDLVADMLATYDAHAAQCTLTYQRTDGSPVTMGYEEMRKRLFAMSFDPYHCVEHRWGAREPAELATCNDGANKRAWYEAEQNLRNQLDRTYEARMDFGLEELREPGPGKGVAQAPDIDTRAYLVSVRNLMSSATGTQPAARQAN
ncbi:MAG: hypothetical protein GC166_13555 [Alphaproteobacteria bacterium]|nr:hypothetical protein [Alphaproteobacteria bacterium]